MLFTRLFMVSTATKLAERIDTYNEKRALKREVLKACKKQKMEVKFDRKGFVKSFKKLD